MLVRVSMLVIKTQERSGFSSLGAKFCIQKQARRDSETIPEIFNKIQSQTWHRGKQHASLVVHRKGRREERKASVCE